MPGVAQNCRVVLVRPRNPLNIGAAARAMANFGFRDLVVVAPHEPVWREARSAVGAAALLDSARAVPDLAEALADRTLVLGTTSGQRRSSAGTSIDLPEARGCIGPSDKVALLFGSEKTGLTNEHFSFCHLVVRIPTSPDCPSMNLAQAVAVCCYELAAARRTAGQPARTRPAAALGEVEELRAELQEVLGAAGYFAAGKRPSDALKLRRLLLRMQLSAPDVQALRGMVAQLRWKIGARP